LLLYEEKPYPRYFEITTTTVKIDMYIHIYTLIWICDVFYIKLRMAPAHHSKSWHNHIITPSLSCKLDYDWEKGAAVRQRNKTGKVRKENLVVI
jgi:hypothetical protein